MRGRSPRRAPESAGDFFVGLSRPIRLQTGLRGTLQPAATEPVTPERIRRILDLEFCSAVLRSTGGRMRFAVFFGLTILVAATPGQAAPAMSPSDMAYRLGVRHELGQGVRKDYAR